MARLSRRLWGCTSLKTAAKEANMVIEPFLFVRRSFGTLFLWKNVNPVQFYYLRKNLRPSFLLELYI